LLSDDIVLLLWVAALDALFVVDGAAASPVAVLPVVPMVVVPAVLPVGLWAVPWAHPDAATPRTNAENATVVSKRFMPFLLMPALRSRAAIS
jgi:hypothetical protein